MKYIGQTRDYKRRMYKHFSDLKKGCHHSYKLQDDFVTYGRENFYSTLLEQLEDMSCEDIGRLEISYIERMDSIKNGYNIKSGGKEISDQGRKNMSDAHIGNTNIHRRSLSSKEVMFVCSLQEFIGNVNRALSYKSGLNRIVFKLIQRRETYLKEIDDYNQLPLEERLSIVPDAFKHYELDIKELKNSSEIRVFCILLLNKINHYSYYDISRIFKVDKRTISRICSGEVMQDSFEKFMLLNIDEIARLQLVTDAVVQTISC